MGFYGFNDPTDSVEALKEVVVLRIGFNPTRSASPCYKPTHACNTHTKMNLSTVKWAQWDKTQSRELLGLFIRVCIALCTTVAHNIAQNRPDNFPSYPLPRQSPLLRWCLFEGRGATVLEQKYLGLSATGYWHHSCHPTKHRRELKALTPTREDDPLVSSYIVQLLDSWGKGDAPFTRRWVVDDAKYTGHVRPFICPSLHAHTTAMVGGAPLLYTTGWICDQCTGFVAMPK